MEINVEGTVFKADKGKSGDREFVSVGVMVSRKDGSGADPIILYPEKVPDGLKYGQSVSVIGQARIDKLYQAVIQVKK